MRINPACWFTALVFLFLVSSNASQQLVIANDHSVPLVLDAKKYKDADAKIYRDDRASSKTCAVVLCKEEDNKYKLFDYKGALPAGDYLLTAWLEAQPLPIQHGLNIIIKTNNRSRRIHQIDFDGTMGNIPGSKTPVAGAGYQPFSFRFTHAGGSLNISIVASTSEVTDGMKRENTKEEKAEGSRPVSMDHLQLSGEKSPGKNRAPVNTDVFEMSDDPTIDKLDHLDKRVALDRVEVTAVNPAPSVVAAVDVDKVHYFPDETVKVTARLDGAAAGGTYKLVADEIVEFDTTRRVFSKDVTLTANQKQEITFDYPLNKGPEFGHEIRCALLLNDKIIHSNSQYFGVSENVYRIGISGHDGVGQDKSKAKLETVRAGMEDNKANYANHFEQFAWAPCTFSNMTPQTEEWYSGQAQYHGTKTGYKLMVDEAHRVGIKVLAYSHAGAGGIAGLENYLKHPEIFAVGNESFGLYNTFLAERAYYNEYAFPDVPGTQPWHFWFAMWSASNQEAADWSAREFINSKKMFDWDGVRWDQPVWGVESIKKQVNAVFPRFIHGYNECFARPATETFLPPSKDTTYFHGIAANHGMMMDESVRLYSGDIKPYYAALASEADYLKRINGLPLIITFDGGTKQDGMMDGRIALAAGERYTYNTSCGDFAFGNITKFLTRFSAFVWDDTARIADAGQIVNVTVGRGPKDATPWFDRTVWLRKLPNGNQILLVNILNPPGYKTFHTRIQIPPSTLYDLSVSAPTPAGAKLVRAVHLSPDLVEGMLPLDVKNEGDKSIVKLPQLRGWSIVAFEYAPATGTLAYPAFKLTTPLEDAQVALAKIEADKAAKAEKTAQDLQAKIDAGLVKPTLVPPDKRPYLDFSKSFNIDEETSQKLARPDEMIIHRNGILDVMHVHGVFAWLDPIENALGLAGGGNYESAWVSYHYWQGHPNGALYNFPDTFEELLTRDVVVLSNVHAFALGPKRRAMLNEYVKAGGGLIIFTGCDTLSMGADHNTALDELLPVTVTGRLTLERNDKGLPLQPVNKEFFASNINWSKSPQVYCIDKSKLKSGVEVLAKAGDFPVIVSQKIGKGRVITMLMNEFGNYADNSLPYWKWNDWPRVLASCIKGAAGDYKSVEKPKTVSRPLNPKEVNPETLGIESAVMNSKEFSRQLKSAQKNMVDARMARALMAAALDNVEKVEDQKMFAEIAEAAGPYLDASFAPLAQKLVNSQHAVLRKAGYKVLGLAGDKSSQGLLVAGLEKNEEVETQRVILVALGQLRAPEAIPAVRAYARKGSEKLLAWGALKRMGDPKAVTESIALYAYSTRAILGFQSSYWGQHETLSRLAARMTPAVARAAYARLDGTVKAMTFLDFDLRFYVESLEPLSDDEIKTIEEFLRSTDSRTVAPLAYTLCGRLPADRAEKFRRNLADAKLPQLQALSQ